MAFNACHVDRYKHQESRTVLGKQSMQFVFHSSKAKVGGLNTETQFTHLVVFLFLAWGAEPEAAASWFSSDGFRTTNCSPAFNALALVKRGNWTLSMTWVLATIVTSSGSLLLFTQKKGSITPFSSSKSLALAKEAMAKCWPLYKAVSFPLGLCFNLLTVPAGYNFNSPFFKFFAAQAPVGFWVNSKVWLSIVCCWHVSSSTFCTVHLAISSCKATLLCTSNFCSMSLEQAVGAPPLCFFHLLNSSKATFNSSLGPKKGEWTKVKPSSSHFTSSNTLEDPTFMLEYLSRQMWKPSNIQNLAQTFGNVGEPFLTKWNKSCFSFKTRPRCSLPICRWSCCSKATSKGLAPTKFSNFKISSFLPWPLSADAVFFCKSSAKASAISLKPPLKAASLPYFSFPKRCKMHLTQSLPKLATLTCSVAADFVAKFQLSCKSCLTHVKDTKKCMALCAALNKTRKCSMKTKVLTVVHILSLLQIFELVTISFVQYLGVPILALWRTHHCSPPVIKAFPKISLPCTSLDWIKPNQIKSN